MKGKKLIGLFLALIPLFIFINSAFGAQNIIHKKISAVYRDIKVVVNGEKIQMEEQPFVLSESGTTMIPIRAVAEALGERVEWDKSTSTVYIGGTGGYAPDKEKTSPPTDLENMTVLRNVGGFSRITSREVRIAKHPFEHAVAANFTCENDGETGEFVVDMWGKYSRVEGFVGVGDLTRNSHHGIHLTILEGEKQLYESGLVKPAEGAKKFEVDVSGRRRLIFRFECQEIEMGEYPNVEAVLANVKFHE